LVKLHAISCQASPRSLGVLAGIEGRSSFQVEVQRSLEETESPNESINTADGRNPAITS